MQPVWPFPGPVNWAQFRRDDEGVDLQYPGTTPVPILAVVPGVLAVAGPDPNGFGVAYPLLNLDSPEMGYTGIYYGHTYPDMSKVGKHVAQGEVIGRTGGASSGGNAAGLPNWLEIGFWPPTPGHGVLMHDYLRTAAGSPGGGPVPPPVGAPAPGAVAKVGLRVILLAAVVVAAAAAGVLAVTAAIGFVGKAVGGVSVGAAR